jgi:hypothetical protein
MAAAALAFAGYPASILSLRTGVVYAEMGPRRHDLGTSVDTAIAAGLQALVVGTPAGVLISWR